MLLVDLRHRKAFRRHQTCIRSWNVKGLRVEQNAKPREKPITKPREVTSKFHSPLLPPVSSLLHPFPQGSFFYHLSFSVLFLMANFHCDLVSTLRRDTAWPCGGSGEIDVQTCSATTGRILTFQRLWKGLMLPFLALGFEGPKMTQKPSTTMSPCFSRQLQVWRPRQLLKINTTTIPCPRPRLKCGAGKESRNKFLTSEGSIKPVRDREREWS